MNFEFCRVNPSDKSWHMRNQTTEKSMLNALSV
jgi:hypothetical protein